MEGRLAGGAPVTRRELLAMPGLAYAQAALRKPNFVFILADDLGIGGLSCYGADNFKTPHLDALAAGGIRFTRAYTAPLCGPSRALLMTGRYAFRTGATNQDATREIKPSAETFLPEILKPAGYRSACVGKWGQLPLGPAAFGFDEYLHAPGSGSYWNTQERAKAYQVNGKSKPLADKEYLPDVMHDFAVDFIERHRASPFCLYYSLSHVHSDILPTPLSAPGSKDLYADNIHYMDRLVGKLVAQLDRLQLRENTLIIFMGDNGTAEGYAEQSTVRGRRISGEKGSMLEGGALVPMLANWRGVTPKGRVTPALVDSTDIVPTFAELAGAKLPDKVIDGQSFVGTLRGQNKHPREWVFLQLARRWYVRDAAWKLNQAGELFDMSQAPFAEPLVSAEKMTPAAQAARARLQAVLAQLNPAGGILDQGDGTGRHANRKNRKKQ
ncbi:MAG: sulfatase-like hydrolase/transferase [Bryobacterales bacterium]|nr:sulfatase-like hydrolase/transferase [Bryobacterales bacterium]